MTSPWPTKKLGEIAKIYPGGKHGLTKADYINQGFPAFSATGQDGFTEKAYDAGFAVILSSIGSRCGKCFYAEGKWTALANTQVIKFDNPITAKFMYYYLNDEKKWPKSGTGQPFISPSIVKEFLVPLPTLHIQQKVVDVLDAIQSAIGVQDKIIEKTKELKKAVMNLLFHYGIKALKVKELLSSRVNELTSSEVEKLGIRLKKTEIGEIPEEWEVVRLGEVCTARKEQVLPKGNEIYVGLEHLDPGSIKLSRYGSSNEVRSLKNKFYPQDILYGKLRPYLDKAVIAENEGICSTDLIVIRCKESRILPLYLINVIHSPRFLNFAINTTTGTNHPRTSWDSLKNFKIPLPSLPEQQEIAEILQTIDQKIEIEQKKKELYEELFKTMLNKLMKGEVNVNNLEI